MRAHGLMAGALRGSDRIDADGDGHATRIGLAQNLRIFDPYSANPIDALVAGRADGFYDESFLDAVTLGRVRVVLPRVIDIDEPFPALAGSLDFLGINYYTRDLVVGALSGPNLYTPAAVPEHPRNDLGWEIYPEGLYRLLRRYARRGWPLIVTENGVADGRDVWRSDLPARPHLRRRPRPRRGGRRRRLHLLVAHRQLRVVARGRAATSGSSRSTSTTRS